MREERGEKARDKEGLFDRDSDVQLIAACDGGVSSFSRRGDAETRVPMQSGLVHTAEST